MKKETEPRCKQRAIQLLHGAPNVRTFHTVEGFLKIGREDSEASSCSNLGKLDKFLSAAWNSNTEVERGDETHGLSAGNSLKHNHIGSNSDEGFSDSEIAEFDVKKVRSFGEECAFKACGPGLKPSEMAAGKIFNEGNEYSPVWVG